ncbi:MAG TPA: protein kinase [Gemmatimonadaceae bacterium]|nr:protein kinase [Gemmatimonadaceae bacterium]
MTPERWRRVKAILSAALDRPTDEQASFLNSACGDDAALKREVDSLAAALAHDDASEANDTDAFARAVVAAAALAALPAMSDGGPALMADLQRVLGAEFQLDRELGGGGMSRVFFGIETALDRPIVVKVLSEEHAHGPSAEWFAREVRFAARLLQGNIVPVLRVGAVGELAFYIMPYRGETLRQRIASSARPTTAEALDVLRDIAKALACAHGEGVVHRDIKPENILLAGGTAMVTDFGIAQTVSDAGTTTPGPALGTPAYMAPEQTWSDAAIGPPADVYSFGVVAYELLAGAHPFGNKKGQNDLIEAQRHDRPRPLAEHRPEISPALGALVMRCLAKESAVRLQSGAELLAELNAMESRVSGGVVVEDPPSVAVLPLTNASAGAEDDFLSDGIAGEIRTALTRMQGLRVAGRASSFPFKGQADVRTIGRELAVETVLKVSVSRDSGRVSIAVELVNAADERSLWSDRYTFELTDIFVVQEQIASGVASALERRERPIVPASQSRQRIVHPRAFELYLRGRALLEQRADGMYQGLQCLEEACRLEPDFAAAHAGISMAFTLFGLFNALRPKDAFPAARAAAERALDIDKDDVLAIVMRAHTALWFEWDFHAAEDRARRALAVAPSSYLAHECLGYVLAAQGRFDDAIEAMERGRKLDPISENATFDLAWVLLLAGRWERAIRELEPALAKHPQMSELRRVYGFCLFYAGHEEEGCDEFKRVLELNTGDRWGSLNLVQALAALGETAEARRLMRELEDRATREPIPAFGISIMHHWLGDDEAALTWLEKALDDRNSWLVMAAHDPSLIRLRDHPRFVRVMQRVRGLS